MEVDIEDGSARHQWKIVVLVDCVGARKKEMALILRYRELQASDVTAVEPAISDRFICSYNQSL